MALVKCPDCQVDVSDLAPLCPRCGRPLGGGAAPARAGGSDTGRIIAGIASFVLPGLGQLVQGRLLAALGFFVASCLFWLIYLGWVIHIWSAVNAARHPR